MTMMIQTQPKVSNNISLCSESELRLSVPMKTDVKALLKGAAAAAAAVELSDKGKQLFRTHLLYTEFTLQLEKHETKPSPRHFLTIV